MNQWPTFDDDDDDSINHTDVKKRNGTKSSIKNVIYIPDNNYKKKKNNNIEDIIDHSIVNILNTMEISWRSSASPQTSNLEKKEVKYTEIDDLAYQ